MQGKKCIQHDVKFRCQLLTSHIHTAHSSRGSNFDFLWQWHQANRQLKAGSIIELEPGGAVGFQIDRYKDS